MVVVKMMKNSCSLGVFGSFLENQMWDIRERQNSSMFLWIEQMKDRKKESESEVTQLCLTLRPHRLWPARLLRPWDSPGKNTGVGAISFSRGSSRPRDWTQVSHTAGRRFNLWAKTTMRYQLRMAIIRKDNKQKVLVRMWRKGSICALLVGL